VNTPYTADQIRENCPPGRTVVTRTEVPGAAPTWTTSRFAESDAEGARTTWETRSDDGTVLDGGSRRATWEELRLHASFPPDRTTVDDVVVATALGESRCHHYRVEGDGAAREFWFAVDRPGMPILVIEHRPDGTAARTEVVEDRVE